MSSYARDGENGCGPLGHTTPRSLASKEKRRLQHSLPDVAGLLWPSSWHMTVWREAAVILSVSNSAAARAFIISVGSHFGSVWTSGIPIIL